MRAVTPMLLTLASACTAIAPPAELDAGPMDAALVDASPDAALTCATDPGPYPYLALIRVSTAAATGTSGGTIWFDRRFTSGGGAQSVLEVLLAGDLTALEDEGPVALGGPESDLRTCRHCILIWPGCDAPASSCAGDPYVAVSGEAYVVRVPELAARTPPVRRELDLALSNVVLVPATIDATTLDTTLHPSAGCVRIPSLRLHGGVFDTECADSHFACRVAETSGSR